MAYFHGLMIQNVAKSTITRTIPIIIVAIITMLTTCVALPRQVVNSPAISARRNDIAVGGVEGLDSLLDPSASTELRQRGAMLYLHGEGLRLLSQNPGERIQRQRRLAELFSPNGIVAEIATVGADNTEASPLTQLRRGGMTRVPILLFNAGDPSPSPDAWRAYVQTWKDAGLGVERVAYIETPNVPPQFNDPNLSFATPEFDGLRGRALAGGMVAMDSPPQFYYWAPAAYRQFVRDNIRWANAQGLSSAVIISPQGNPDDLKDSLDFAQSTQRMVAEFNALPSSYRPQYYLVQNYSNGVRIGREDQADTVASVALWVMSNALTYKPN